MDNRRAVPYVRNLSGEGQARSSVLDAMPKLLDRPEFAAPSMCSEVDMEGFMLTRIRHCDKNIASTQQPGISGLRPNRYFICRRFIRQSQPYLGCYADRYKQCWAAECPKSKSGK